ncbi:hypothetical protein Agabi119p4_3786 [Agaricus bisporus var. burnettii]|uniref:Uncharacterized protein n=1 Tax=Agaricus bisporus var. burnettii TaxID=192524 RepID=A0A8H7KIB0_AGABI|nr:hypothetical protein Agabi119p4_3786 [Agaricus bisporus var. burnettii]
MLVSNESFQPLNPDVYLNHVSPAEAHAIDIRRDLSFIILGATLWDIFTYLHIDTEIARHSRLTFVTGSFIFSRLFASGHVFLVAINIEPHNWIYVLSGCLCLLSMMTSSFLFLQRILAIYHDDKRVRRCFWVLWVVTSLSDIVIPVGGHQNRIPETNQNKDSDIQTWVSTSAWCLLLFDSAVIIAMSYKVFLTQACGNFAENEIFSLYKLLTGRTLPAFSRAIFRGGVQYYTITVGVVLLAGFTLVLPVPQIYKGTVSTALAPLMASMACRVFRNTKLFYSEDFVMETL